MQATRIRIGSSSPDLELVAQGRRGSGFGRRSGQIRAPPGRERWEVRGGCVASLGWLGEVASPECLEAAALLAAGRWRLAKW